MMPKTITLLQFDTRITGEDKITSIMDLMRCKFHGGGGTRIGPVLEWANEHKPQLLMVFTDGEFEFLNGFTKVDTMWLVHDDPNWKAPFGKTIHYELPK
jgi:predicted metal-dependent peptidase